MTPGKLATQAGHAFLDAYLAALAADPDLAAEYRSDHQGTKVALLVPTEAALLHAYHRAQRAGLPCALITDQGHVMPPNFDGSPIVTALGLGPVRRPEARSITNRFALVP